MTTPRDWMVWARLNASRNIGLSPTSARALNVAGNSSMVFFQKNGTRPHLIRTSSRLPWHKAQHIDIRHRRDVVTRAQITGRAEHIKEAVNCGPARMLGEAAAHVPLRSSASRLSMVEIKKVDKVVATCHHFGMPILQTRPIAWIKAARKGLWRVPEECTGRNARCIVGRGRGRASRSSIHPKSYRRRNRF